MRSSSEIRVSGSGDYLGDPGFRDIVDHEPVVVASVGVITGEGRIRGEGLLVVESGWLGKVGHVHRADCETCSGSGADTQLASTKVLARILRVHIRTTGSARSDNP